MKVVLLSAGLGVRLSPITDSIPKQMISICGKPLIEYIIEQLIDAEFDEFCIVLGKNGHLIKNYLKDGKKYGVNIQYVYQKNEKGTADATLFAKDFVKNDPFFLYLSDTIIPNDFTATVKQMLSSEYPINLISSKIDMADSKNTGNLIVKKNEVINISEKPKSKNTNLAWAGVSFFKNNDIFDYIENLKTSHTTEYEITTAMENTLIDNNHIGNFLSKEFIDYGTISGLLKSLKFIFDNKNFKNSEFESNNLSKPKFYIGNNCVISNNVQIDSYTSIGDNVTIGNDVHISNSIILDNVKISDNQYIVNSVISKNGILKI